MSQEFVEKSEILGEFPEMGRIVPEVGDSKIKELFVYSYRLIYEISKEGAEILAIIHGRQNFKGNFNEVRK